MSYLYIIKLIEKTLIERNVGSRITPLAHQNMIMAVLEYIHYIELFSKGVLRGFAFESTIPQVLDNLFSCYVSLCPAGRTTTFYNFENESGLPIQVICSQNEIKYVILFWNKYYWAKNELSLSSDIVETLGDFGADFNNDFYKGRQ